jgi:tRNA pseudouridine13 synthase
MVTSTALPEWARAWGAPVAEARLKTQPADFKVVEQLGYELDGVGEHLWLWLEKTGHNTEWVVNALAKHWQLPPKAFGYAGKKDRQAVTQQWISVHLPGRADPDWSSLPWEGVRVVTAKRHGRKLQTGGLAGNRFELCLRDCQGDRTEIEQRLCRLAEEGVPNYFGPQRFGKAGQNLAAATAWLKQPRNRLPRHLRGLYLSALRSALFNDVLSQRVQHGTWQQALPGDVLMTQTGGCFVAEALDEALCQRVADGALSPTGLLSGRGALMTQGQPRDWEQSVIAAHPLWQNGLEKAGMKQARRALRLFASEMAWQWADETTLKLTFALPAGSYATTLLREWVQV